MDLKLFSGNWVHGYWAVEVSCRLWEMLPSWFTNDLREVAEMVVTGRWFESLKSYGH